MQGIIPLILAAILFGVWGFANKHAVQGAHPFTVQWIYTIPYMLSMPFWYWMARRTVPEASSNPRTFLWTILASMCAISAVVLVFFALRHRSASFATSVTAVYPAITLFLAVLAGDESPNATRLGGIALIIGGVVLVQWSGG